MDTLSSFVFQPVWILDVEIAYNVFFNKCLYKLLTWIPSWRLTPSTLSKTIGKWWPEETGITRREDPNSIPLQTLKRGRWNKGKKVFLLHNLSSFNNVLRSFRTVHHGTRTIALHYCYWCKIREEWKIRWRSKSSQLMKERNLWIKIMSFYIGKTKLTMIWMNMNSFRFTDLLLTFYLFLFFIPSPSLCSNLNLSKL